MNEPRLVQLGISKIDLILHVAWTLLVGRVEEHLACKSTETAILDIVMATSGGSNSTMLLYESGC